MKKIIKNLIFLSAVIFSINTAHCYTLNYSELYSYIYNQVQNQDKKEILKYSPQYEIKISGIAKEPIVTFDNLKPKIEIVSQSDKFEVNSYKRVYIRDSRNNLVKSFPINVQTKIYKNVLVAKETIPFNQMLNNNNTQIEKREISRYLTKTLDKMPDNVIAKRNFQKGSVILSDGVKSQAVVFRNSQINICFITDKGLEIKLQGRALKDGAIGETILVKSDKYNKTYSATVDSTSQVTVRI